MHTQNYGTNVVVPVMNEQGNEEFVELKVKEQSQNNPCKGCFFYDEKENDSLISPCSLNNKQYRLLGSCQERIFVK